MADILIALLQTIRHTTTALALAFKPPVTVPAAVQQLDKIADEFARVTSCVVGAAFHGTYGVLVDEWREGAESIGSELERLLGILREHQHATSTGDENPYLAHTGMVWAAIDRMKGLSRTENRAVIKRWEGQKEIVKDAWTEFKEFLEDQELDDEDDEEDDFGDEDDEDDEWGVLERGMAGGKMSAEEKSRAEAVSPAQSSDGFQLTIQAKPLLGLHQLLHASIPRFLPCLADPTTETTYHDLVLASASTVAAFDTAISTMYPEQDESEISASLRDLGGESRKTIEQLQSRLSVSSLSATQTQRDQFESFLGKWLERLEKETASWEERRLSVKSLDSALP